MSKKKKRTRKEKERAEFRRIQQLDKIVKTGSNKSDFLISKSIVRKTQKPSFTEPISTIALDEAQYISANIKKSLIFTGLFALIIAILYILETKFGYLGPSAKKLMSLLTK